MGKHNRRESRCTVAKTNGRAKTFFVSKGDDTRQVILRQALELSSELGLEGLTVGVLAKRVGMSKSGLYAHFDSKEALQSQVLEAAAERFVEVVLRPAIALPRGLPRVEALFHRWVDWSVAELRGGCPFIAASAEYDDRPGPMRDLVVHHLEAVYATISRAAAIAVDEGHFRVDLDIDQFAFEFWGILLSFHHFARLLERDDAQQLASSAFDLLLARATSQSNTN